MIYTPRRAMISGIDVLLSSLGSPVFHRPRPIPAVNIMLRGEGLKSNGGYSNFGGD
jgi:hypothetical protein